MLFAKQTKIEPIHLKEDEKSNCLWCKMV